MMTAEYGGSGGKPIVSGMAVEEPDIEIGAGVSSKAISRRMQTDKSGSHGPRSSRDEGAEGKGGGGRWRGGGGGGGGRDKHRGGGGGSEHRRGGGAGGSDEPVVPDLPAGITVGPNGINFPPNFHFGA